MYIFVVHFCFFHLYTHTLQNMVPLKGSTITPTNYAMESQCDPSLPLYSTIYHYEVHFFFSDELVDQNFYYQLADRMKAKDKTHFIYNFSSFLQIETNFPHHLKHNYNLSTSNPYHQNVLESIRNEVISSHFIPAMPYVYMNLSQLIRTAPITFVTRPIPNKYKKTNY